MGGSSGDAAELPGLPQGRYVVVPESNAPHHTLATAQELPELPYVGVVGTLGSGEPIDLYRVTLSSGVSGLNFGLESDQSALTIPMQLQVFDASGHLLGEWSLGGQSSTSLYGGLGALPAGSTLYFGITAGSTSGIAGSFDGDRLSALGRPPAESGFDNLSERRAERPCFGDLAGNRFAAAGLERTWCTAIIWGFPARFDFAFE